MSIIKFDGTHDCINIDPIELKQAPHKTNDSNDHNSNNGLITSIWGPPTWESFHSFTFGFPIKPTDDEKIDYLNYFNLFGKVLPCICCRTSYQKFIVQPNTLLDMNVVQSRETLTKWGFRLHNAVNDKLGVDYGETYEELCYKYESYRARCAVNEKGCLMPIDMKAKSYQKADIRRAPIIDIKYCIALKDYAKMIGLHNYDNFLTYYTSLMRNTKEWGARDCVARRIIKYMRKNGVDPLNSDGLPSIHEMMLISMLSSSLEKSELDTVLKNISNTH
jgi:hypothetical protein